MGIVLHHNPKLIIIAHTLQCAIIPRTYISPHCFFLEWLPSSPPTNSLLILNPTSFPKKITCQLDDLASDDPVENDIEKLLPSLVNLVEISKDEEVAMRELFATLKAILIEHFPNVKMELFGSYPR